MTTSQIKKENNVNKVGVFVNASIEEVLQMVDECRLHMYSCMVMKRPGTAKRSLIYFP
jgi:phosphoribosylanthranilate isomerase